MRSTSTWWKKTAVAICGAVFGFGGGCLPENFFVDKSGEIVNGLIVSGINSALAETDFEI